MDAPERIWARKHPVRHGGHWHDSTHSSDVAETVNGAAGTINPFVEYTRADLPPTLSAALAMPEINALVDAAKTLLAELRANRYASDHMPEGSRVALSTALRAIERPPNDN